MRIRLLLIPALTALVCVATIATLRWFIEFGNPHALWLSALVVLWAALWAWHLAWRERTLRALFKTGTLETRVASFSIRRATLRFLFSAVGLFMLVLTAAEPQWGEVRRQVQRQGIDVVLAVDASRSMLAEDVAPDRLRAATEEINELLTSLHGDRVGLVVYAGFAFAQSPLTSDYGAIRLYLDRIKPDVFPAQGTAIGRAIQEGRRLLVGGEDPNFQRAPNQLLIVVSDGEDHETEPVQAAREAFNDGVRVYTIGVGTTGGGRIPTRDARNNLTGYLNDASGQVVQTKLVDTQLQEIAQAGGGAYFQLTQPGSAARFLKDEIDRYDEATTSSVLRSHYVSRPYFFLVTAFVMLLLSLAMDPRSSSYRRARRSANALLLILPLAGTALSGCIDLRHRDPNVHRAIELADAGDLSAALERINRAGNDAQEQHAFYFNRGRILEANGDEELAQADYLRALASSKGDLRTAAMIGIGNALVQQGHYEAALERYRRALIIDPTNERARRNYEIAHRLLFPPCSALDDTLEPNNTIAAASALPPETYVGEWAPRYQSAHAQQTPAPPSATTNAEDEKTPLVSCGGDLDLYALPLEGGELVNLRVRFHRLRDDNGGPPIEEQIEPTALRIAILDREGEPIAVDQGLRERGDTPVDGRRVQRRIRDLQIPAEQAPYFLQIAADTGLEYNYTIALDITPPCSAVDDEFEDNDTAADAREIDSGEHNLRACNHDEDWFQVPLEPGDDLFVDVTPGTLDDGQPAPFSAGLQAGSDPSESPRAERLPSDAALHAMALRDTPQNTTARLVVRAEDDHEGPYQVALWKFPPCPTGNDRFEPNDRPNQATPLTAEQNILRHLRLCPGDEDWYMMQLPTDQDQTQTPNAATSNPNTSDNDPILFAALAEYEDPQRNLIIELWDPATGRLLTRSQDLQNTDYTSSENGATIAVEELHPETTSVLVRVIGDAGYYHLRFPETQPTPPPSDASNNGEQGENQSPSNANQDDTSDNDDEENSPDNEQDEQNPQDEPQNEQNQANEDEATPSEEEERQALMQLLESLEDNGMNLQLMQAIERQPPIRMQNEW